MDDKILTFPVNDARPLETPLRVLIVEDHRCIASALRRALEGCGGIGRVDVADSVAGAIGTVEAAEPDLILLDVILGEENGLTLLLKLPLGRPRCLCLTSFVDPDLVAQSLDYGAWGYLVKEEGLPALHEALMAVAAGHLAFSEEAAHLAMAARPDLFPSASAHHLTAPDCAASRGSAVIVSRKDRGGGRQGVGRGPWRGAGCAQWSVDETGRVRRAYAALHG